MHEVDVALRLVECQGGGIALHRNVLHSQIGYAPHFVKDKLKI